VTLLGAHDTLAWVVVASSALVGVWAVAAQWVEPLRWRGLWWAVAGAQSLLFVQAAVGAALYSRLTGPSPRMHMFYGFLTIVVVALLYGYRLPIGPRRYVLYGMGSLFIMGLSLQAMTNAGQLS
jgi:hypothetical protein